MGTFIIIVCVGTLLWYAYNFIYDMYFAGKGVVSAATVEEKEVDIGDELKDFQQFDVDGNAKDGSDDTNILPASDDESRYAPSTGTVSYSEETSSGQSGIVIRPDDAVDDAAADSKASELSEDEGDARADDSHENDDASKFGADYDYFQEMIDGTSYSGGIDPDMYAAALDDLENDRPGSERSFLNGLYLSEQQEAA